MEQRSAGASQIRKIEPSDFSRVADLLGRAFDDDPVMNFLAKPDARRSARIRAMMDLGLRKMTFPYGETYVTEGFEGAALWNPPGGRPHGFVSEIKLLPGMVKVAGLGRLPRVIGALSLMEKKHPTEPHYYLLGIGVEPSMQGKGFGSQLIAPMVERCDREGVAAYLESSKDRNVPLYERHGFKVVEEMNLPDGGPRVWRMWREAKK